MSACPRVLVMAFTPEQKKIREVLHTQYADCLSVNLALSDFPEQFSWLMKRKSCHSSMPDSILKMLSQQKRSQLSSDAIAYCTTAFDQFYGQMQRSHFGSAFKLFNTVSYATCLHYFHLMFDYVAQTLQSQHIDHCVFFNVPHLGYDTLLASVCHHLGLSVTILSQSSTIPNSMFSMRSFSQYGHLGDSVSVQKQFQKVTLPQKQVDTPFYMREISCKTKTPNFRVRCQDYADLLLGLFVSRAVPVPKKHDWLGFFRRAQYLRTFFSLHRIRFSRLFNQGALDYFESLIVRESLQVDFKKPYIYFALHLQPEATTDPLGGVYQDQALALEHLSLLLPKDHLIYVKENPKQTDYQRGKLFFDRLSRLSSVRWVPSQTNTFDLIQHSKCVATVTGTVGWEALLWHKPVVTFGYAWYNTFPGVFRFHLDLNFDSVFSYEISHTAIERYYHQFIKHLPEGLVHMLYLQLLEPGSFCLTKNAQRVASYLAVLITGQQPYVFESVSSDVSDADTQGVKYV